MFINIIVLYQGSVAYLLSHHSTHHCEMNCHHEWLLYVTPMP